MDTARFDLVVIGSGPAGEKAAAQAAYFGKRVAVVEMAPKPGGAAVHTGTLPSKTLREAALYLSGHRARDLYGIAVELEAEATLPRLMARRQAISDIETTRILNNLARHQVTTFQGFGRVVGPHAVEVCRDGEDITLEASYILVAAGSKPYRPKDIDFEDSSIHDSDEVLNIERMPRSLVILGGGVIGCEYACMFAALGVSVTVVDARDEILPFLDQEIIQCLKEAMVRLGLRFVQGVRWGQVARRGSDIEVQLSDGEVLRAEQLLFAAGRGGATEGLGLESVGLSTDRRGYIPVDDHYRTEVSHILAAGDVIGFPALASVSMEQGRVAVCHAFDLGYKDSVGAWMPYGIYTIPEASAVGETEQSCREKGINYVAGRAHYAANARGQISGDQHGMTKLLVEAETRRILGVHVVGERATELVHVGQAALHLAGTVDLFIDMVFNYPTLSEAYKYAAYDCLGALKRPTIR